MNLYLFSKITNKSTEIATVVADNPEHALDILKNDGRTGFDLEVWFPLSENDYNLVDSGIPFSLEIENTKGE